MQEHRTQNAASCDFRATIRHVAAGGVLSRQETTAVIDAIVGAQASHAQIGALLTAWHMRGETVDEIVAAAMVMRAHMVKVRAPAAAMDILGTGADYAGTYNISTCAAFIVAGAGVPVAKQGNRAFSSRSGAADVLQALGLRLDLGVQEIESCIAEAGMGFMFAPAHHPALQQVMSVRVDLGIRTLFNILGPLLNPAGVKRHLIGVYARQWVHPLAQALTQLGSERVLVVHGADGLDEITLTGPTFAALAVNGAISDFEITPEMAGLERVAPAALRAGEPQANARALRDVLEGAPGPYRDIALINAAGALIAAGRSDDWPQAMRLARASVDEGRALDCLHRLIEVSRRRTPIP